MPIFAASFYTFGIWQKNNLVFKIIATVNSCLWVIYNIYVFSIMGIVFECIMIVCGIIGFIRYVKTEKLKVENEDMKNGISEAGESR